MSIVLDALKKTSASEKKSQSTTQAPGGTPSRGSFLTRRRLALAVLAGFVIGFGIFLGLPDRNEPAVKKESPPTESPLAILHEEGAALVRAGDYPGALARFSEIVSARPDAPQGHNNLGLVFKKMGNGEEAAAEYRKALALDPGFVEAMNNLAVLLREQGRMEEAESFFLQAIGKSPEYAEAHLNYALLLDSAGKGGASRSHFQTYLRLVPPEDPNARRVREILHP